MFHRKTPTTYFCMSIGAFLLLMLTGTLAACGGSNQESNQGKPTPTVSIPNVTIVAKDFSFDMPNTLPAGLVDITMDNVGSEPHQANLARLDDGVTKDQILADLRTKDPRSAVRPLLTYVGGPNVVLSNQKQEVILKLTPGQYVALCSIVTADHVSHIAKGMINFFQVTGPASQASEPAAQGQVIMKDFSFVLPSPFKAGPLLLNVINQGPQPHAITIIKPAPGKTMQDVMNFFDHRTGPQPFDEAGGMSVLSSGLSGWLKLDLKPGNYIAACYVSDTAMHQLHLRMGMITSFTVV